MPPANRGPSTTDEPPIDAGIYLIKDGKPIDGAGPDAADQERSEVQRAMAAAAGPLQAHLRRRRTAAAADRWRNDGKLSQAPARRDAVRPGRHVEPVQARERSRAASVPKGSVTATGDPYAAFSHSMRARTNWDGQGADAGLYDNSDIHAIRILAMEPATVARRRSAVLQPRRRTAAHPRRDSRCASSATGRQAAARSRRQSRHQLPRQDPRRRRLHLPDARQGRHGAEHGPDLAPAPARRNPQRLRRLPRPQPEADALQGHRRRQARLPALRPDQADAAVDHQDRTISPARSGTSRTRPACASRRAS